MKTKGPGARDGERSFGRHPSNSFTTPDTKRTKGQGPGLVNVLLAATPSNSFTTLRIKGPEARDGERSFGCQPSDSFMISGD